MNSAVRIASRLARLALVSALWCAVAPAPALAARHALVVGNNAYPSGQLRSAVNDARDIAQALQQVGFDVLLRENASREQMFQAIREFGARLREGDTALFYYAGHAIQLRDRNYLIPVDAQIQQEDDVTYYSIDVVEVLQRMDRARARFNVLMLDACRDNPFTSAVRITQVGLAQMSAPPGTLIAYATAPGQVAREGVGRNGVYTRHLLRHIGTPDQPIELVLKRVREGVFNETRGQQVPWDASSLRSDLVLAGAAPAQSVARPAPGGVTAETRTAVDRTFWESIKDGRNPKEYEAYLEQFPDGVFAVLAQTRLKQIQERGAAPARPADGANAAASQPAGRPATAPSSPEAGVPKAAADAGTAPVAESVDVPARAGESGPGGSTQVASRGAGSAANGGGAPSPVAAPPMPDAVALAAPAPAASNGARPMILPDGSTYTGALKDGKPNGRGRLSSASAGTYDGMFVLGVREGEGDQSWPSGERYVGAFKADMPHGQGKMQFANGDRYEGGYQNGRFQGKGTLVTKSGFRYQGDFDAGIRTGRGQASFPNGDRYDGDFSDDVASGKGVMNFASGDRYDGSFAGGRPEGRGTYTFANGARYEGQFSDGQMSGLGTYHFANGDRHEGMFEAGAAKGTGVHFFASGGRFEGNFSDRGRTATGVLIDAAGERRAGVLENGQFRRRDG